MELAGIRRAAALPLPLDGLDARHLSPVDTLLHLALHPPLHHAYAVPLLAYVDLDHLVAAHASDAFWSGLLARAALPPTYPVEPTQKQEGPDQAQQLRRSYPLTREMALFAPDTGAGPGGFRLQGRSPPWFMGREAICCSRNSYLMCKSHTKN